MSIRHCLIVVTVILLALLAGCGKAGSTMDDVRVLALVPERYGANAHLLLDDFDRFGWDVTLAGLTESVRPCSTFATAHGSSAIAVDVLVSEITDVTEYDVVVIMPSTKYSYPNFEDFLASPQVLDLVAAAAEDGMIVYALCEGKQVLNAAGVAEGITLLPDKRPMIEGNIVLSERGLYNHIPNSNAIAIALENENPTSRGSGEINTVSAAAPVPEAVWSRTLGGPNADGARSVQATSDGGFIVAGYTFSFGAGYADIYLVKTDSEGSPVWSKTFGDSGWEYGFSVTQTRDGGYAVVGYTTSHGEGSRDVYLVRTDADGNELWSKTFGGPGVDVGRSIVEVSDGGFVVAGYTKSFGAGLDDVYLIRTDAEGNALWTKTFGQDGPEMAESVIETSDGGFVVVGATGSYTRNRDVYMVKVDAQGNEVLVKTFSYPGHLSYDWGAAVRQVSDGGLVFAGNSDWSLGSDDTSEAILVRTDLEGNEIWKNSFGESNYYDYGNGVLETSDGGFVVVGATKTTRTLDNSAYVIRVDSEGHELWKKIMGGAGSDWGSAICRADDGGYVIAGHTNSYGAGSFDIWLVKVGE